MGIFVFVSVLILEVALTIYRVKTKNNQNKIKSWVRIAAFIAFIGLTLTSVIDWGFQWYLLGILLFVLSIISGLRIATKKYGNKPYKKWRVVLRGIVMIIILPLLLYLQLYFHSMRNLK